MKLTILYHQVSQEVSTNDTNCSNDSSTKIDTGRYLGDSLYDVEASSSNESFYTAECSSHTSLPDVDYKKSKSSLLADDNDDCVRGDCDVDLKVMEPADITNKSEVVIDRNAMADIKNNNNDDKPIEKGKESQSYWSRILSYFTRYKVDPRTSAVKETREKFESYTNEKVAGIKETAEIMMKGSKSADIVRNPSTSDNISLRKTKSLPATTQMMMATPDAILGKGHGRALQTTNRLPGAQHLTAHRRPFEIILPRRNCLSKEKMAVDTLTQFVQNSYENSKPSSHKFIADHDDTCDSDVDDFLLW